MQNSYGSTVVLRMMNLHIGACVTKLSLAVASGMYDETSATMSSFDGALSFRDWGTAFL